jgi:hypothetical protein
MTKKKLPSKREIIPASPTSASKARKTFEDDFKRNAVARLRAAHKPLLISPLSLEYGAISFTSGPISSTSNHQGKSFVCPGVLPQAL